MPISSISPPLINSSNPWATTLADLRTLYACPYTGAVTTRTCTLNGFAHDDSIHQFTFFDAHTFECIHQAGNASCEKASASLNTLGYSPLRLEETLRNVFLVVKEVGNGKGFIISVTGSPEEVGEAYKLISDLDRNIKGLGKEGKLWMEINLSCPNITGKPPPAYDEASLLEFLLAVRLAREKFGGMVEVGIKTPPYTNPRDFETVKKALLSSASEEKDVPISFITATNTLGSSLLLQPSSASPSSSAAAFKPTLSSADSLGIGGMAGSPLHPLALGNVRMLRRMLDSEAVLKGIQIIGIGGVSDAAGFARMKSVGAEIVGVGTALGRKGVGIFEEITNGGKGARL